MTGRGICITLPIRIIPKIEVEYDWEGEYLAPICALKQEEEGEGEFWLELLCITLGFQDPNVCTYARVRPRHKHNNQIVKRFTAEELEEFEYETVYIPQNYQIEQSVTRHQGFPLSTKLSASTEYRIEISEVYRIACSDAHTSIDILPVPLSSTSYFKSGIGLSRVIILAGRLISGAPDTIAVLFGLENGTPWCEVITAVSGFELKGIVNDRVSAELHTIIVEHFKVSSRHRSDRWKGRLTKLLNGRTPRVGIAISKAAIGNRNEENAKVILVLYISVCID